LFALGLPLARIPYKRKYLHFVVKYPGAYIMLMVKALPYMAVYRGFRYLEYPAYLNLFDKRGLRVFLWLSGIQFLLD
jgi:hypothetical protein